MADPLQDVLGKLIDVGLLERVGDAIRFRPKDLQSTKPVLRLLTQRYGMLEGYEAQVLAKIPPFLFTVGPTPISLIRVILEESGIHAIRRD